MPQRVLLLAVWLLWEGFLLLLYNMARALAYLISARSFVCCSCMTTMSFSFSMLSAISLLSI